MKQFYPCFTEKNVKMLQRSLIVFLFLKKGTPWSFIVRGPWTFIWVFSNGLRDELSCLSAKAPVVGKRVVRRQVDEGPFQYQKAIVLKARFKKGCYLWVRISSRCQSCIGCISEEFQKPLFPNSYLNGVCAALTWTKDQVWDKRQ